VDTLAGATATTSISSQFARPRRETPNGGNDTVYADVVFAASGPNVETLVLVGLDDVHGVTRRARRHHALDVGGDISDVFSNINGIGNDLGNTLIGTAGDNVSTAASAPTRCWAGPAMTPMWSTTSVMSSLICEPGKSTRCSPMSTTL